MATDWHYRGAQIYHSEWREPRAEIAAGGDSAWPLHSPLGGRSIAVLMAYWPPRGMSSGDPASRW
jgi:hypothetical protein